MPHSALACGVGEYNIETAGKGYDEFLILPVGMPAAFFAAGYIIDPVSACDIKGNMLPLFDE